jgi:hypothetical protein
MDKYKYKNTGFDVIFATGTNSTLTGYKKSNADIQVLTKFSQLPNQTFGYKINNTDIGATACPKYTKYTASGTHTCNSKATGVYLILVGGGGGGGSGGSTGDSQNSYYGDGGGGGGGGGMLALRINKSQNTTMEIPITIVIVIGNGGPGGAALGDNASGNSGTDGGDTTATIWLTGNDIVATAIGGKKGIGGGSDTTSGTATGTGGAGGSTNITNATVSTNYNKAGADGATGAAGTANNYDTSNGGAGGKSGYNNESGFNIETITNGDGGAGGQGDEQDVSEYGKAGTAGSKGVAYIFEYFE